MLVDELNDYDVTGPGVGRSKFWVDGNQVMYGETMKHRKYSTHEMAAKFAMYAEKQAAGNALEGPQFDPAPTCQYVKGDVWLVV